MSKYYTKPKRSKPGVTQRVNKGVPKGTQATNKACTTPKGCRGRLNISLKRGQKHPRPLNKAWTTQQDCREG